MECETVRELLGNYLDEELTMPVRQMIDLHVAGCSGCERELLSLTSALEAIRSTPAVEFPSPWFAERLLHSLARSNDTSLTSDDRSTPNLQLGLW